MVRGLEAGTLLGTGVVLVLESCSFNTVLKDGVLPLAARLDGAGPGVLLKKPAMLCCLVFDFCVEPPVFFGAVRGVAISLPSMPRAMMCLYVYVALIDDNNDNAMIARRMSQT